eukprot:scaffold624_cov402-Prasinococcus_capsulatus_cf.AAC.68
MRRKLNLGNHSSPLEATVAHVHVAARPLLPRPRPLTGAAADVEEDLSLLEADLTCSQAHDSRAIFSLACPGQPGSYQANQPSCQFGLGPRIKGERLS